jgi:hypothetical protein
LLASLRDAFRIGTFPVVVVAALLEHRLQAAMPLASRTNFGLFLFLALLF